MSAPFIAVDWFRVIWDLVQRDHNLAAIERHTGIASSTLRGYLDGSHPPHWRGELLVDLWCDVCGKARVDLPLAEVVISPRVVKAGHTVSEETLAVGRLEASWRGLVAKVGRAGT